MTQYGEALNTLKAETNGLVIVNPLEAGYYMIVSGFQNFKDKQGVEKVMVLLGVLGSYILAAATGEVDFTKLSESIISWKILWRYGFA